METRANYVLIGSFTLAVIAAAFGFVLLFQSLHTTKARSPIRIVFEGPASGLRNGGSVNFNGIRIGEVISVKLDNPRRVVALAMVENNAPIRKDTLVGLEFQGLTGVAAISLKGGEEAAPPVPLDEDGVPVLATKYTEALPNGPKHLLQKYADDRPELTAAGEFDPNNTDEYVVPDGHLFMMGDNRDNSADSRFIRDGLGFVPMENVIGRAQFIFFSFDANHPWWQVWQWPLEVRWSRLLKGVD